MAKDLEGCDGLAKTTAPAAGMTRRALMLMRGHASNGFKQKECEQALTHCRSMTKNIQFSNNAWLALDAWLVKGVVYNFGCKFTKSTKMIQQIVSKMSSLIDMLIISYVC